MEVVKNDSPLISVVLPTYNRAGMLEKAVRSIVDQKYQNWELIIIDNCSIDDTDAVIAKFNDSRIKFLKIQNLNHDEGIVAQNMGFYFWFVDLD